MIGHEKPGIIGYQYGLKKCTSCTSSPLQPLNTRMSCQESALLACFWIKEFGKLMCLSQVVSSDLHITAQECV